MVAPPRCGVRGKLLPGWNVKAGPFVGRFFCIVVSIDAFARECIHIQFLKLVKNFLFPRKCFKDLHVVFPLIPEVLYEYMSGYTNAAR
jgi:hypothetical protein